MKKCIENIESRERRARVRGCISSKTPKPPKIKEDEDEEWF